MWTLDPAPFEIPTCTTNNPVPLSNYYNTEFPSDIYDYVIESEDMRNNELAVIDPACLKLDVCLMEGEPFPAAGPLRLGGRALRTLWQHRNELPERLWAPSEEVLSYMQKMHNKKVTVSQFCIDGLRLFNPYGVSCVFYFVRYNGEVRWARTPICYNRGHKFWALVLNR